MRSPKGRVLIDASMVLALAGHAAMGLALGLGFSFSLIFFDTLGLKALIAHSVDPRSTTIVFAGIFALAFAVGATLTGLVLIMMEREKRSAGQ